MIFFFFIFDDVKISSFICVTKYIYYNFQWLQIYNLYLIKNNFVFHFFPILGKFVSLFYINLSNKCYKFKRKKKIHVICNCLQVNNLLYNISFLHCLSSHYNDNQWSNNFINTAVTFFLIYFLLPLFFYLVLLCDVKLDKIFSYFVNN